MAALQPNLTYWNPADDAAALLRETVADCDLSGKLAVELGVLRYGGVLHWSILWKAFEHGTTTVSDDDPPHIGFKVMEVRNPSNDPKEFMYRFSFKQANSFTATVSHNVLSSSKSDENSSFIDLQ